MQKDLIERKNLFDDWNGQKLKEQKKIDTINYVLLHSASRINHPHLPLRFLLILPEIYHQVENQLIKKKLHQQYIITVFYIFCL